MASAFGLHLYALLRKRRMSMRAFARAVGVPAPNISEMKNGLRPMPFPQAVHWADFLALTGEERERFLDLAALTHAPPRLRDLIADVEQAYGRTLRALADGPKGRAARRRTTGR